MIKNSSQEPLKEIIKGKETTKENIVKENLLKENSIKENKTKEITKENVKDKKVSKRWDQSLQAKSMPILNNPEFDHFQMQQQQQQPIITDEIIPLYDETPISIINPLPERVVAPFPIQTPVLSWTGEVIIENTIGGIPFDCRFRPTGHWRDSYFCDIFHACVHGQQRKTYACPIVGERTYFDEITQRCEFVHLNPAICAAV